MLHIIFQLLRSNRFLVSKARHSKGSSTSFPHSPPSEFHIFQNLFVCESSYSNLRSFPSLQGVGSCLRSLIISCGDEVLPTGLQSCTSLSKLIIECPNLISIPELRELHSLMEFRIFDCYNLKSIPDLRELQFFHPSMHCQLQKVHASTR